MDEKHVQAEAGVDGGRDVDGAKFNQWVIPSSALLDREGPADRQVRFVRPAWFVERRIHKERGSCPLQSRAGIEEESGLVDVEL